MIDRRSLLGAGTALTFAGPILAGDRSLDVALVNGRIWTGMPGAGFETAVGLSGSRIAAVGAGPVRAARGRSTQVIDLKGAFVTPGFIDNHTHFLVGSAELSKPVLLDAGSRDEFARRVGAAARANPGKWILGGSWDEQRLGGALPTRDWVDAVTPDTPVAVPRTDLHMFMANSVALRLAGITRDTPDPPGGVIDRDAHGEPTGIFRDNAKDLIQRVIPPPTDAEQDAALRAGIAHGLSRGVTQVHCPEINWTVYESTRRVRSAGETGMRFYVFVPLADWERMARIVATEGRGDEWVRWGAMKALTDGSLGSRTALFREPYTDAPDQHGVRVTSLANLREWIGRADAHGLHVAAHAIGDLANDDILDIFASVAAQNGPSDRRFRIEHAQHLSAAAVPRFARQKVIASVQPYHAIDDGRWAERRIGKARLAGTYAFRSLIDGGACVTFGSDWPVAPLDPLLAIYAAVTRRTIDGANPGGWLPDQKITVAQALTAVTASNGYAGFQERQVGRIAPGYWADLTILDRNLFEIPPETIPDVKVLQTWVGGVRRFGETV